jgi:hypothetical protein
MADASVTLDLDAREFDARLAAIEQKVAQGSKRIAGSLGGMGSGLSNTLGQYLTVGATAAAVKSIVDYGARVQDLHERFGVSTDAIQHFGNAAEKNGSSLEAVTMGFNKLEIARSKALKGDGQLTDAFLDLGISIIDLQKLKPEELMTKIGASSMTAAEMVKILGKNALELVPTLGGIADGTIKVDNAIDSMNVKRLKDASDVWKDLLETLRAAGGNLTGDVISGADKLQKKMQDVHTAIVSGSKSTWSKAGDCFHDLFAGKFSAAAKDMKDILTFSGAHGGQYTGFGANPDGTSKTKPDGTKADADKPDWRKRAEEAELHETYKQTQEANKLTLGQLASLNAFDGEQSTYHGKYIGGDILKAQAAQREKELAGDAAFSGNEKEFQFHTTRFNQLTSGIGSLKDSERNAGLLKQVDSIEKSAATIAENSKKFDARNR